jgi:hypothetical protein
MLVFGMAPVATSVATSSEIDLGNPGTLSGHKTFTFDQLDQTPLGGQSLSLNFTFANHQFVRLFTITSSLFDAQISLQTNGTGDLGTLHGTGYLVDHNNDPIPGFGVTGNASGDGLLSLGLFPLLKDKNGTPNTDLSRPLDFFSIHFDLALPVIQDPSIHITGGEFDLISGFDKPFGIGPDLPRDIVSDGGITIVLLAIGLAFIGVAKLRDGRRDFIT